MRLRIGQSGIPFVLGIGLLSGVLILLPLTSRLARAAPGDTYCVLQPSGPIITSVCDEIFTSVQAAVDMAAGGETILVAG